MAHKTAQDALADDVAILGERYGTAFHHCCQELWRVSSNWDRYEALFGSSERVELLNSSSNHFWAVIQNMLHEYVLLGICRLTDPPGSGTRLNLSVSQLLELDPTDSKGELAERVLLAMSSARFARTWRDKRISHNDLIQISGQANLVEPSTGIGIVAAIMAIHDVFRWIMGRYFKGDMHLMDLGDADANTLLVALARAKALKDQERADLKAGKFDHFINPPYRYPTDDYGRSTRYKNQSPLPQPKPYEGKLPLAT